MQMPCSSTTAASIWLKLSEQERWGGRWELREEMRMAGLAVVWSQRALEVSISVWLQWEPTWLIFFLRDNSGWCVVNRPYHHSEARVKVGIRGHCRKSVRDRGAGLMAWWVAVIFRIHFEGSPAELIDELNVGCGEKNQGFRYLTWTTGTIVGNGEAQGRSKLGREIPG